MPDPHGSSRFLSRARIFSRIAAVFSVLVGSLVLLGWLFEISDFKSVYGEITMKSNTAVCLILAGLSLFFFNDAHKALRIVSNVCAIAIALLGSLILSQHIVGWNLHIDQLLFTEPAGALATTSPGRMGITASSNFAMFGVALLLMNRGKAVSFAQVLTILAGLWALLAVIGYGYHAEELFAIARYTGIAFHTAIALSLLAAGILARCIDIGFISVFSDEGPAGMMARRLAIVGLVAPFLLGWFGLEGQRAGHFDVGLGLAILVVSMMTLFMTSVWLAAIKLKHIEQKRTAAEALAKEGEQKLHEKEAQTAAEAGALARLNALSARLWETSTFNDGLDEMLDATIELLGADKGNIQILDEKKRVLTIAAQRGFDQEFLDFFHEVDAEDESACGRALRSGERIIIEDVETDEPYAPLRSVARAAGYRAVQSTPLIAKDGSPLGMLSTHFASVHRPSEPDLRRLNLYVLLATGFIERFRLEQERERLLAREKILRTEAESANRIKDEFLATISHELRTPLNAMLGWATLMGSGKLDPSTTQRGIVTIERNAKSQAQLIEDLLDVSRIISGKMRLNMQPIIATPVIQAAIDSVQPAADAKQILLEMTIDPEANSLVADASRLQQIVWNLLSNAIKFTPVGGRVQLRLHRVDSLAEITVRDTGEGISKDFLPFVFDRFQQADASITRKHAGLGLGLAITRHLVEMHGGTIAVASDGAGLGSTFKIQLPLSPLNGASARLDVLEKSMVYEQSAAGIPLPNLNGVRVLAIDDAGDTRDLLRVALERYGANVTTAGSSGEGFKVLQGWKPDVIVCDIGMPDEDGYSFIQKVRRLEPERGGKTPAIALTGYVRVEDRMRALEAGYHMFVPKPVEATELGGVIATLTRRKA